MVCSDAAPYRLLPGHVALDLGVEEVVGAVEHRGVELRPHFGQGLLELVARMAELPHFVHVVLGGELDRVLVNPGKRDQK